MTTSKGEPWLHEALAQHFSLDELKLICADAGVDPDSVAFSERGKELYAYCIVETFRKQDQLPVLIAACARSRNHLDWHAYRIAITVPAEWAGLFASQRALDALHQLPSPPDNFIGRKAEIDQLCAAIRGNAERGIPSAIVSSIEGMGGIGKTTLALVVANELRTDFDDAQLFIQLNANGLKPLTISEARDQVLRSYYPEAKLPDNERELTSLYRSALAGQRGLILFDDARDDDYIQSLLPPSGWAVLITSRNTLATGTPLRLHELHRADSITLVRILAARITEAQGNDLAEACGDLPVALRLVGADLKRYRTRSIEAYIRELRANRAGKLKLADVFSYSFAQLTAQQQAALGALSNMPASFDESAGVAVMGDEGANDLLAEFAALNWLEYDEAIERFNWHDLLREFIAGQTPQDLKQAAAFRHAQHFTQVVHEIDRLYLAGNDNIPQGLALYDREHLHLSAAFTFLSGTGTSDDGYAQATALNNLVNAVAYVTELRFHPRERIRWHEAQLAASRRIGDLHSECTALSNLGKSYADLGQSAHAIELFEQQLSIARDIGDRRSEGDALGYLGYEYTNVGQSVRAIDLLEQQLSITREIGDRRSEGAALGNLGTAYRELNQPMRAIEYYEQYLTITREIGNRRGESSALNNLGITYKDLGQPARTIEYLEQTLAIDREIGDRQGEGIDLGNIGGAYSDMGQPARAIEYLEQALAINRETGNRRNEGANLGNIGAAYYFLGQPARAIEYYEQYLAISRETGDLRSEGFSLEGLGEMYRDLGDQPRAIRCFEDAFAIFHQINNRLGQTETAWHYGILLELGGDITRAIELMQLRVNYRREIGHPDAEKDAAYVDELRARLAGTHPQLRNDA